MEIKRIIHPGLVIVLLIFLFPAILAFSSSETAGSDHLAVFGPVVQAKLASIQALPIVITDNDGFKTNFTGDGTADSPYVLKDKFIDATPTGGLPGINISNTDAHFRIENVMVNGSTGFNTGGIHLVNVTNGQIIDCTVTDSFAGFALFGSKNNTLIGNNATGNDQGFGIDSSSNNTLIGNIARDNTQFGFILINLSNKSTLIGNNATGNDHGFGLAGSSNNTLTGNNASGNSDSGFYINEYLGYYSNNNTLKGNIATGNTQKGFYHKNSSNNMLAGNTASGNRRGFYLDVSSNYSNLTANNATSNDYGFVLSGSSFNTLTGNSAFNNVVGNTIYAGGFVLASSSNNNSLTGNYASENSEGFYLTSSSNNTLTGNAAIENYRGFALLSSSHNNTLTWNTVYNNTNYGISLSSSSDNLVHLNFLIDNNQGGTRQGYDGNPDNSWDNGTHGNYWSDYTGIDIGNGIGDLNYTLFGPTPPANDTRPLVFTLLAYLSTLQVSGPADRVFEAGSTGILSLTWLPNTNIPVNTTYKLYLEDNLEDFGNWTLGIAITLAVDLTGASPDDYNITLVVSDYSNKTVAHTVWVTVEDTTSPVITYTGPDAITFEEDSIGNTFTVSATDLYPGNYTLYKDSTEVFSGNWTNGTAFTVSFDDLSLPPGVYTFKLVVRDTSGNEAIVEVTVTVTVKPIPPTTPTTPTTTSTTTTGGPSPGWTSPLVLLSLACSAVLLSRRRSRRKK